METLDTLVDWATEEESGRCRDETLMSVLELVSGINTFKRKELEAHFDLIYAQFI